MEHFNLYVAIFLALTLIFFTSLYFKYVRDGPPRKRSSCGCCDDGSHALPYFTIAPPKTKHNGPNVHTIAQELSGPRREDEAFIDRVFDATLQIVKQLPKRAKISNEVQLRMYGLFKQAQIGNINKPEPSKLNFAESAKWASWNEQKGKPQMIAKREYFEVVYAHIVRPYDLNVLFFENASEVPDKFKEQILKNEKNGGGGGMNMNFAVNSKIEHKFDEEIHGSPNELFNKFDLTQTEKEIDLDEMRAYIKENKIAINKQNEHGMTFLNFAVDNNKYELTKMLIEEFSADVAVCDDMGYTPLHCAAMNEDKAMIQLLLDHGADVNAKSLDDEQETPKDLAESDEIKQMLT